jgi:hypothetical protein
MFGKEPPAVRSLDAGLIMKQIERLDQRIKERFPNRNLSRVSGEFCDVARETREIIEWIGRPHLLLRISTILVVFILLVVLVSAILNLAVPAESLTLPEFVQLVEAGLNDVILLGAAMIFLLTAESRVKRHRALKALHVLRSLAHVVDMHQLTKDPMRILGGGPMTASSPREEMSAFELTRYLDYCSELLSLMGIIATLYVQDFDDSVVLSTVNEIQNLTNGLSNKIWQKIMLIESKVANMPLTDGRVYTLPEPMPEEALP